jgi:hypothetical protein
LTEARSGEGQPLGDLVVERRETIDVTDAPRTVIVDTTHAKDGVLDVASALRCSLAEDGSSSLAASRRKKLAFVGDVVVSRLRPYRRQIALVHPAALDRASMQPLAISTEFYVLSPARKGEDIAFLLPFLLSEDVQSILFGAQEGGHHPRVPRPSLFALRVPHELVASRQVTSAEVHHALTRYYEGVGVLQFALGLGCPHPAR